MEVNHLSYEPLAEYSEVFGHEMDTVEFENMLSKIGCQKAIAILSRFSSLHNSVCSHGIRGYSPRLEVKSISSGHIRELDGNWVYIISLKQLCALSLSSCLKN